MGRETSRDGGWAAGGTGRFRPGIASAAAAWPGIGLGLWNWAAHAAAGIASAGGDRGGFFECGAGDSRTTGSGFALRGYAHQTPGTDSEPLARDSVMADRSGRGESAVGSVFVGDLRELFAALAFFAA